MKNLFTTVILLAVISLQGIAQNITVLNNYKLVALRPAATNNIIPRFEKIQPDLESGIKDVLRHHKLPVMSNQQEVAEKGIKPCEIINCTYYIHYATGMMYNAIVTYSLKFTDCQEKEILVLNGKKSVGAAVGAKGYTELFKELLKPYLAYAYTYDSGTKVK